MRGDVVQRQLAFALFGAHLAQAEQPRQPAIAVAVDRVSEQARRIGQVEPAADQRLNPAPLHALCMRTTPASVLRSATPIASMPSASAVQHQLDRVRRPAQEGKGRRDAKLDIRRALDRRRRHVRAPHQLERRKSDLFRASPEQPMDEPVGRAAAAVADQAFAINPVAAAFGVLDAVIIAQPRRSTAGATIRARSARALRRGRCHAPRAATRTAAACLRAWHRSRRSLRAGRAGVGGLLPSACEGRGSRRRG